MRTSLLPLLALLPTSAQLRPAALAPAAPSLPAALAPAPLDTAAALHHLFVRYRARRLRVAVATLLLGTGLTIASAASVPHAHDPLEAGFDGFGAILAGTVTAVLVPVEVVAWGQASRRHERRTSELWRAQRLPARVREALKPSDFVQPAR